MGDAWIYSQNHVAMERTAPMLAELGYSPRRLQTTESLWPFPADGAQRRGPDLVVILDHGGDAAGICERLRADEDLGVVPVLVGVEADGLSHGFELPTTHELIVAPFTAAELRTRIARARRAVSGTSGEEVLRSEDLELNLATYQVTVDGATADFTYMEYELLKFLMTHPRRVFSREALLTSVWRYDFYGGARTVDVHVRRIRAKLGTHHAGKIQTVRRVGYRFDG